MPGVIDESSQVSLCRLCGLWIASLVAGISRSPRQVDSRFILILVVDVVTAPGVTADGDLTVLLLVELEATARDDD